MVDQSKIQNRTSNIVSGVLLAAGRSSRMGQPKQLVNWQGVPLVRHAAQIALRSRIDELIVVIGYESSRVRDALADLPVRIVQNDSYEAGQATSVRAGIEAVSETARAAVIMLVDQPLLQAATIDALIDAWEPPYLIVAPRYDGQRGNPVLLARPLFPELLDLRGDFGARNVIKAYSGALITVEVADRGVIIDMDTPDMYRRLTERSGDER